MTWTSTMKIKNFKPKDGSSITKFADPNKSAKERLNAFLAAYYRKEKSPGKEAGRSDDPEDPKIFVRDNHEDLIYLIYDSFWQHLDNIQLKKSKKSGTDESDLIDIILPSLEKVLQYLPDKINELWHYQGISTMLKEILSPNNILAPNNTLEFKKKGIKLTILWIMGLLGRHTVRNDAVDVFNSILPEIRRPEAENGDFETVIPRFEFLLKNLTSNLMLVHWPDLQGQELLKKQIEGFRTVFNLCKNSYFFKILNCNKRKESSTRCKDSRPRPPLPPTRELRYERMNSTSSQRSDAETPSPSPHQLSLTESIFGSFTEEEDLQEQKCKNCDSASHRTRSCIHCDRCPGKPSHTRQDCPIEIANEVDTHFNKPANFISSEEIERLFSLNDVILKWFVNLCKSILPHGKPQCSFVKKHEEEFLPNEDFEDQVRICEIVDRVLFTDKDNVRLMNDAFEHGPLVLQRRTEENLMRIMTPDEQQSSFEKMITLYSEFIHNIKDYNVESKSEIEGYGKSEIRCPEFLSDTRKRPRRESEKKVKQRIKQFLKSASLNMAPLLRYPDNYMSFSTPTKRKIDELAVMTIGFFVVIVQQIEQADASTCFRIILCMIRTIEHNFQKNIPLDSYKVQLLNLLHVVRFVGRKVILPPNTWEHLRQLLFKLEEKDSASNEIWYELMETLTQEIFAQVYGVQYTKSSCDKEEKLVKTKGKLPLSIKEKPGLRIFHAALAKIKGPFGNKEKHISIVKKIHGGERTHHPSSPTEYHYHGLNKVFEKSTATRNTAGGNHYDDQNETDDELRPNLGEHPIILWRRFLTLKGNPNNYLASGELHHKMFLYLSRILDMLLWLDDNKEKQDRKLSGTPNYRDNVPEHPVFTYVYHILPWFFETFTRSPNTEEFLPGKREAMRMICRCLIRLNPIKPPVPLLHLLYNTLLNCLKRGQLKPISYSNYGGGYKKTHRQDLLFEVVRGTKHLFSLNLSGCQLGDLMACLSGGAFKVLESQNQEGPKAEAIVLLGSLYTYPWAGEPLKQEIVKHMTNVAKLEKDQFHRSRAIQMLGYMIMTLLSKRSFVKWDIPESPTLIINRIEAEPHNEIVANNNRADSEELKTLINIVMLQVQSPNSKVALSALSVVRDIAGDFNKLLQVDPNLPKQIMENLLASLNVHMEYQQQAPEDNTPDRYSPTKSRSTIIDPLTAEELMTSQVGGAGAGGVPSRDNVIKSYQEAVIPGTIMALVDWVLNMPQDIHNTQPTVQQHPSGCSDYRDHTRLLKTIFKVLQLVALEKCFTEHVKEYCVSQKERAEREYKISPVQEGDTTVDQQVDMSYPVLPGSQEPQLHKNVKCCAEAALLVFCQRYHQFPLCGGPDYSSSMVYEYNRDERNGDMLHFHKKDDIQILMINKSSVVSLVELAGIPPKLESSLDLPFETQTGYSRVIFRNVAGRFSWLSKRLFALKEPPDSPLPPSDLVDQTANLPEVIDYPTLTPSRTLCRSDSGAPSLLNPNDDKDFLYQTIDYIKKTSDELPFYRELKKEHREEEHREEDKVGSMLRNQKTNEEKADNSIASDTGTIGSDRSSFDKSNMFECGSPFQQSRGLASSLGLFSWCKSSSVNGRLVELLDQKKMIEKEKDVCGGLSELDGHFNREIQKFGVIYIAHGDEKRKEALSHNVGSKEFEEFVAGLGWEVNWKDLRGYVPTIGTDVMKSTTVHYANPTLEILFHIGTRLEPGNQEAALYRFKYIGNDYIGVIWSEHERDVNIDTFKSAYLNYVIVIYPMKEIKKCRVQVIVNFGEKDKCKIEHGIGPLFDGALVDRHLLPDLVRKTIINAGRLITVDQNRPRFYRDRAKALDKLQTYMRDVTFEEFACELMSPSLVSFDKYKDYSTVIDPPKQPPHRTTTTTTRNKKSAARQSGTGYSSQDNASENERGERKKKWKTRELSDSDNIYSKR